MDGVTQRSVWYTVSPTCGERESALPRPESPSNAATDTRAEGSPLPALPWARLKWLPPSLAGSSSRDRLPRAGGATLPHAAAAPTWRPQNTSAPPLQAWPRRLLVAPLWGQSSRLLLPGKHSSPRTPLPCTALGLRCPLRPASSWHRLQHGQLEPAGRVRSKLQQVQAAGAFQGTPNAHGDRSGSSCIRLRTPLPPRAATRGTDLPAGNVFHDDGLLFQVLPQEPQGPETEADLELATAAAVRPQARLRRAAPAQTAGPSHAQGPSGSKAVAPEVTGHGEKACIGMAGWTPAGHETPHELLASSLLTKPEGARAGSAVRQPRESTLGSVLGRERGAPIAVRTHRARGEGVRHGQRGPAAPGVYSTAVADPGRSWSAAPGPNSKRNRGSRDPGEVTVQSPLRAAIAPPPREGGLAPQSGR